MGTQEQTNVVKTNDVGLLLTVSPVTGMEIREAVVVTAASEITPIVVDETEQHPCTFADDRDIWERQPIEGDKAWALFQIYRDLPPYDRSLMATYRAHTGSVAASLPPNVGRNAVKWRWHDRAEAYDRKQDTRIRLELEDRRLKARIATANLGRDMRDKAVHALSVLEAITTVVKTRPDGSQVRVTRSNLSTREIVSLAEIGVKIERLALGEEDGRSGTQINIAGVVMSGGLSDEELISRAASVIGSRTNIAGGGNQPGRISVDGNVLLGTGSERPGDGRVIEAGPDKTGRAPKANTPSGAKKG